MRTSKQNVLIRQKRMIEILSSRQDAPVSLIENELGITSKVAWSDLRILMELGLIQKRKGRVSLSNHTALDQRLLFEVGAKRSIAQYVLRNYLLRENTGNRVCIFMDGGSTINILFQEMIEHEDVSKLNLNIVTNNVSLTSLKYPDNINLILSGGQYLPQDKVLVGRAIDLFSQYKAKLAIMSSTNINFQGYLGHNNTECMTKQAMMANAEEIIILSDHSKFEFFGGELISKFYWGKQKSDAQDVRFLQIKLDDGQYKRVKIITSASQDGDNSSLIRKFFGKDARLSQKEVDQCIIFA